MKHEHPWRLKNYSFERKRSSGHGQKLKLHNSKHSNAATIADANVKKTFEEVMVLLTEADHTDTRMPGRNSYSQAHASFL